MEHKSKVGSRTHLHLAPSCLLQILLLPASLLTRLTPWLPWLPWLPTRHGTETATACAERMQWHMDSMVQLHGMAWSQYEPGNLQNRDYAYSTFPFSILNDLNGLTWYDHHPSSKSWHFSSSFWPSFHLSRSQPRAGSWHDMKNCGFSHDPFEAHGVTDLDLKKWPTVNTALGFF